MQGRLKSIYSIYKKMIRKKIPVRQVYDARALRIIVDDEGGSRTGDAWAAAYRWAALQCSHTHHSLLSSKYLICKWLSPSNAAKQQSHGHLCQKDRGYYALVSRQV